MNQAFYRHGEQANEKQLQTISADMGQRMLGNVDGMVTVCDGVECPLVALKGTPAGDRNR